MASRKNRPVWACMGLAALLFADAAFATVGFQQVTVPDRNGKSMQAGIWYPSNVQTSPHPLGLFSQDVALHAPIAGQGLPLILISHGSSGGSELRRQPAGSDRPAAANESGARLGPIVVAGQFEFESKAHRYLWILVGRIHELGADRRNAGTGAYGAAVRIEPECA
jgi:hypothetical protein